MRYELINGQPKPITRAVIGDMIYTNPPDSLLEANNIGYTRTITAAPALNDETKRLVHTYVVLDGSITDIYTTVDKSPSELIDLYQSKIAAIYAEAEEFKNNGKITYPGTGKEYIPRWVFEFYNTALINKAMYFPTNESAIPISAVDGTADNMTFDQFVQLYGYMITSYQTYTAAQNEQIAEYNELIADLREEIAEATVSPVEMEEEEEGDLDEESDENE